NDHIIMSSSNTEVTCSIDNLFVEPTIINNPQGNLGDDETIHYTIDKLLETNDNFLIYGIKESGKTILLDKMFLESTKRFNTFNRVPILLKFSDFKNKDI